MPIKLNGATNGSVELDVPAAVGSDLQITLPATAGTAIVKAADGSVDLGSVDIDSSGNVKIASEHLRFNTSGKGIIFGTDGGSNRPSIIGNYTSSSDNNIVFNVTGTERIRLDSSGRLLLGTTSGSGDPRLIVQGKASNATDEGGIFIRRGSQLPGAGHGIGDIFFGNNSGHVGAQINVQSDGIWGTNDYPARIGFRTTADGASSPVERMRLTQKGVLKVSNNGTYINATAPYNEFTSAYGNEYAFRIKASGASGQQFGLRIETVNDQNDEPRLFFSCVGGSTTRAVIRSNGGLVNYQSNNVNLCDEREKKNIVSLDAKWDKVKSWELKKFHYNEDADTDDKRYGVIAQQVEEHCPEVLTEWLKQEAEDAVLDEDGNVVTAAVPEILRKGVKEQQMMWMAIKALQEAQARIETLETKVAALEATP